MIRTLIEAYRGSTVRELYPVVLIGMAALGGAVSEAAHGNFIGTGVYLGIGTVGMTGAGAIIINKNNNPN